MNCPLITAPERAGHCVQCDAPLTGRKRRWCSTAHADWWSRNHEWTMASGEAVRRAAVFDPEHPGSAMHRIWILCDQCGKECTFIWTRNGDRAEAEVNHVEPRVGAGYGKGCWNHQTNLQVLCHGCHVAETMRQKRERIAGLWPGLEPSLNPGFASWREAGIFIETGALPARLTEPTPQTLELWPA